MTISSTNRKAGPYEGNGVVTLFPFGFKVFKTADVLVTFTGTSGVDSPLTLDSDYTVTLNSDQDLNPGGVITYPRSGSPLSVLAQGQHLTLSGGLKNLQPTDLPDLSAWFPHVVEDALDRATILIQQLQEQVDRSIKISVSDSPLTPLPPALNRANELLGFDALGNVVLYPITSSVGAGDRTPFSLVLGTDFNAGDTHVTLPRSPGSQGNLEVNFDAAPQDFTQWQANGTTLNFTSPIPVGITRIWGYIGTTLSTEVPPSGSVGNSQLVDGAVNDRAVATPATPADGIASSKLAFLQSGAGAQWRSVQEKARDFVSVMDFMTQAQVDDVRSGAATLDVTAACAAAIATGKSVFWPEGTYKVSPIGAALPGTEPNRTSAWLLSSGQRMFGVGRKTHLVWGTPATRQFFFKAANCTNVEIDSMFFDGGYGAFVVDPTADGSVDGTTVRNCFFANQLLDVLGGVQFPINSASKYHKNMTVSGCTTDGPSYHSILFTNCYNAKAIGNTFRNVTNGFCVDSSQGSRNVIIANNMADNVLYFCKAESSDTAAVNPQQWEAHEICITGNVARSVNTYAILVNSAADNIVIANNVLTGFSQYGIDLDQAAGVTYNGSITCSNNVLQAASGSSNAVGIRDYITNGATAHNFVGNVITNVLNGFDVARPNVNITGGEIVASASAIVLEASQPLDGVNISGVAMTATTGVNVNGNANTAKRVTVANNNINFTAAGVYSQANVVLFNVSDNLLHSSAPTLGGIVLTNPTNCQVSGNLINMNSGVLNSISTSGATTGCIITNNISNAPLSIAGAAGGTVTTGNITSAAYQP